MHKSFLELDSDHIEHLYTRSQTAKRLKIDNSIPNDTIRDSIFAVHNNIIVPCVKEFSGKYLLSLSSGYRCPELNKAIGSVPYSQHTKGEAADFEFLGLANKELFEWIKQNLTFDQLLLEFYDPAGGINSGWIHCSYAMYRANRNQAMSIK